MENNILLSICIPTYNGGERLIRALECIDSAIKQRTDIEVIVSDNASDDNTAILLSNYNSRFLKCYKNKENLGFNGNLIKLIDEYATGKFCWTIGDDDFVDSDSIDIICNLLYQNEDIDYMAIGYRVMDLEKYDSFKIFRSGTPEYVITDYFHCLESNARLGNVLGTYMATHIFRLDSVKKLPKDELNSKSFDSYYTVFPNSYLMINAFKNSTRCMCLGEKLITAIKHPKNYGDDGGKKWMNVLEHILFDYLKKCESMSQGRIKLTNNYLALFNINLRINVKRLMKLESGPINYKYFFSLNAIKCLKTKKY